MEPIEESPQTPSHYTREPWWVMFLGGVVCFFIPLLKIGSLLQKFSLLGVFNFMVLAGILGTFGAGVLVMRSHIQSTNWANFVLWGGIFLVALGACIVAVYMF